MKVGILPLGRRRAGFDPEWGAHILSRLDESLEKVAFTPFRPPTKIVDEGTLREALTECRAAETEAIVVLQPTMSDGNMAAAFPQLWNGPVVLWATPEKPTGSMISSCSLVGAHTFASTLRQLNHPFELVYGMPGDGPCMDELLAAIRRVVVWRRLRAGRLGLIGYHAPGFIDMQADPFQLKNGIGLQLRHFGLRDLLQAMEELNDDEVAVDVAEVKAMGLPLLDVQESDLPTASRYYLAMTKLLREEELAAVAIRCWSELPNVVGQWPYLAIVRMCTQGIPIACEGDVDGAVTLLLGEWLGFGQTYLSDWLEHDEETITLWHAGSAPLGLCDAVGAEFGPKIACHFNNRKPAVIDANIQAGQPVTVYRVWRCDNAYHLTAFEGETIAPRRHLKGTNGLARIDGHDVRRLFDDLCHAGMPHHVAVSIGHHADNLRRMARTMQIEFV